MKHLLTPLGIFCVADLISFSSVFLKFSVNYPFLKITL